MKAWHFVAGETLRNGDPIPPDGEKLEHTGHLSLCVSGLHASKRLLDALQYAPGSTVCRVECGGEIIQSGDKLVCSERTILWRFDAAEVLREFARRCALDVISLWDAPPIVAEYLRAGNEKIRDAAWAAAWAAARADADADAVAAVRAAAEAADASRAGAVAAAWAAAIDAAKAGAVAAAWAAIDAAKAGAVAAAWAAAIDAAKAASRVATEAAAWAAARKTQNNRLTQMVTKRAQTEKSSANTHRPAGLRAGGSFDPTMVG